MNSDEYICVRAEKDIKIYSRVEERVVSFKMQVDRVAIPIRNLCTLFVESDLYHHWFPFTKLSKRLGMFKHSSQVAYLKLWMPPPFSNRYSNMWGAGMNRLHMPQRRIVVVSKSIDPNKETELLGIPLLHEGGYLMRTYYYSMEIKVLNRNEVSLTGLAKVDPRIKAIPFSLQKWGAKKFIEYLFKKMLRFSKSFEGTVYEAGLKNCQNEEFYNWLDGQLEQTYRSNGL